MSISKGRGDCFGYFVLAVPFFPSFHTNRLLYPWLYKEFSLTEDLA